MPGQIDPAPGRRAAAARHRAVRRRRPVVLLAVLVLALCVAGGWYVVHEDAPASASHDATSGHPSSSASPRGRSVSPALLLDVVQTSTYTPHQSWHEVGTDDNTTGSGINSVCQSQRFADPHGVGTVVRTFASEGTPKRGLVETIEISRSAGAARAAYRTTLGWFAGCERARLQLLGSYRVSGVGEQARLLELRIPNRVRRTYVVGLVRSGRLTVSTVLETVDGDPPQLSRALRVLYEATRRLCDADAAGPCPTYVRAAPALPPPSGETPGTLAAADLPAVGSINHRWVGTRPVPADLNAAATSCDRADFRRSGATTAMTRVFLVPQARLPKRFGLTETYGGFGDDARAAAFVAKVRSAMSSCHRRDLGAKVSQAAEQPHGYRGSAYFLWRLDTEIARGDSVGYWTGVTRVGRYVAQVTFTPTGDDDVDADTFRALVSRARDRLFELAP